MSLDIIAERPGPSVQDILARDPVAAPPVMRQESPAADLGLDDVVADQDTDNLKRIQRGLRATKKPGVTLARYQESRIRHFHRTLDGLHGGGMI